MVAAGAGDRNKTPGGRLIGLLRALIKLWALLGGAVLVGLAILTGASALSHLVFDQPFPGDYEIVRHFVAIAAFAFLPYCQLENANVTVDIFTESMGERAKTVMHLIASVIAGLLAILLLWRMWYGMWDYMRFPEYSQVLAIPLWTAYPAILASLLLLLIAALITLGEDIRALRSLRPRAPDEAIPNV
jgi:TRAP-type C4-dicarboxylate transport system permease small subunit